MPNHCHCETFFAEAILRLSSTLEIASVAALPRNYSPLFDIASNRVRSKLFNLKGKTIMLLLLLLTMVSDSQQPAGTLTIRAENLQHNDGLAVVSLFRADDDMPKKPFRKVSGSIINGKATIVFDSIPYGEYAAILFHDENSNGEVDHSWGFPAEPMGFSNGWKLTLFSGMPNFSKLRFEFSGTEIEYSIAIQD